MKSRRTGAAAGGRRFRPMCSGRRGPRGGAGGSPGCRRSLPSSRNTTGPGARTQIAAAGAAGRLLRKVRREALVKEDQNGAVRTTVVSGAATCGIRLREEVQGARTVPGGGQQGDSVWLGGGRPRHPEREGKRDRGGGGGGGT